MTTPDNTCFTPWLFSHCAAYSNGIARKINREVKTGFLPRAVRISLFFAISNLLFINTGYGQITQKVGTSGNYSLSSISTLTITAPSVSNGDLMIASFSIHNTASGKHVTLGGWTEIGFVDYENGNPSWHAATWLYHVCDGTESGSSLDFNLNDNANKGAGAIIVFSGVNTTTPIDVTGSTSSSSGSASVTATSITTQTNNAAVLMLVSAQDFASSVSSFSTASGPTLSTAMSYAQESSAQGKGAGTVGIGKGIKSPAGSTGAGAATLGTSKKWGAMMIALREQSTSTMKANTIAASNVCARSTKVPIQSFYIAQTTSYNLTGLSFTTSGTYAATGDITKFQLWTNSTNSLGGATQISSDITTSLGTGSHSFASFTQTLQLNSDRYFWITMDVAATPTSGNTIAVNVLTTANITVSGGTTSGSSTAGGDQTLKTAGTWLGVTSIDWGTGTNWCGGVPTSTTDVVIPTGTTYAPTIASGTTAACKSITINTSAVLTLANSATSLLNISGDFTNNGTLTAGAASIISFVGSSAQGIAGSSTTTFSNLTINETGSSTSVTSATNAFNVSGNLTVTQGNLIVQATNANYTITGNLSVAANGTLTHSVNWDTYSKQLSVAGNLTIDGTFTYTVRSHVQMTGAGSKTLKSGSSAFSILTLVTGAYSASGTLTVNDNFYPMFNSTGSFNTNGQTVTAGAGCMNYGGTLNVDGGSLNVTGGLLIGSNTVATNNGTVNLSSGTLTTDGITLGHTASTTANTITQSGGTLQVNGAVTINQPVAAVTNAWNINAQTATVTGLVSLAGTNTTTTRVGKIVITTGTLNAFGSLTCATATGTNLVHVIDMSTGGGTGNLNLKGALTVGTSTLTAGTSGSNFNYVDANAQNINFFPGGAYNNLKINNTNASTGASLSTAITTGNVTGNISVGDGTNSSLFTTSNNNIGFNNSKTLTVASGSTMNAGTSVITFTATLANPAVIINGTFKTANTVGFSGSITTAINSTNSPNISLGANSTIEYNAGAAQVVTDRDYANLTVSNSTGTKTWTLSATTRTVSGNLTIYANAPFTFAGASQSVNIQGNWIKNSSGTFTPGTSTVIFNGADQSIGGSTSTVFNNLTFAGSGAKTIGTAASGTLASGILNISSGVTASVTNTNIAVNELRFAVVTQASGTWGYGPGTPPTYKNQTYFASTTGYLNVATGCTGGTWLGTASTSWNNGANWCGGIPTSATAVVIPASGISNWPELSTGITGNCNSLTFGGAASRLNFTGGNLAVAGNVTFTNGVITATASSTISVSGTWTGTGTTFTPGTYLTVDYNGAAQTVSALAYYNLTLSGSDVKTLTGLSTVNGNFTMNGNNTTSASTTVTLNIGGNLTVNQGNTLYLVNGNPSLDVTGNTIISGTVTSGGAAKTFKGDLTINSTGSWTDNGYIPAYNFQGNLTNDGYFSAANGLCTFSGTSKTIGGSSAISITSAAITGSYTNNGTLSLETFLSGTGTLTQGANSTLNIGTTSGISGLNASSNTNTVNYTAAGSQTVKAVNYSSLGISGGGSSVKTLGGSSTVSGILTIAASTTLAFGTTAQTLTLSGTGSNTLANSGTIDMSTGPNAAHVLKIAASGIASFGTLIPGTGSTVEYNGGTQAINGVTYHNLAITNAGTKTAPASTLTVGGNLAINTGSTLAANGSYGISVAGNWSNSGTFTHNSGTVSFAGGTQSIAGSSATAFNNLSINSGSTTTITSAGQTVKGILKSDGTLNTGGYLTLLSTAAQTALIDGSGSGSVAGNVTVQRYLASGFGYKYVSSPFTAATVSQFAEEANLSATFPTFYRYDENQETAWWFDYTTTTNALVPMMGYAANFGSSTDPKTISISGGVSNGTLTPLSLSNNNKTHTRGFNLVGNPYPSPINWEAGSGWTKTNIDNAIYYFDAGSTDQYVGSYSSYIGGHSSDGLATGIIPAMQGFFVHVSDGTFPVVATLGFTNTVRVTTLNPLYHKKTFAPALPLIRLSAGFTDNTGKPDPLVILLDNQASDAFNREQDAVKMMNTSPDVPSFYSVAANSPFAIKALPEPYDSVTIIPLGISTLKAGEIGFRLLTTEGTDPGLHLYFKDYMDGSVMALGNSAVYRAYLEAGEYNRRFALLVSRNEIPVRNNTNHELDAYVSDGKLYVYLDQLKDQMAELRVTDMLGRILHSEKVTGTGIYPASFRCTPGIYIVSLRTEYNVMTRKIFIR